jgi:hypothetical protein
MASATPDEYLCPITLSIMTDPVIGSDGRTYERSAITQWLRSHPHSPLTREPMTLSSLKPNYALKSAIERYQKGNKPPPKKIKKIVPPPPPPQPPPPPPQPSAPPAQDFYYAIQIYQEEIQQQIAVRRSQLQTINLEGERRKKLILSILFLIVILILIIVFSKLFSSD